MSNRNHTVCLSENTISELNKIAEKISQSGDFTDRVNVFIAAISVIVACMAAIIAYRSYITSKNNYIFSLHQLYFQVLLSLPHQDEDAVLTKHHYQILGNFNELVANSFYKSKIGKEEIELYSVHMNEEKVVDFVRKQRKNHGEKAYEYYWKWLTENKIV